MKENGPFWQSRKFWMEVVVAGIFLTLELTERVQFTPEQVLTFLLTLAGIGVCTHAATDIAALVTQSRAQVSEDGVSQLDGPDTSPGTPKAKASVPPPNPGSD